MRRTLTPKRWRVIPGEIQAEARLQIELGVHPIVARLLVQRGLTTPDDAYRFLNPSLDAFHDPFLLPDIEPACARLKQALHSKEKILVHGDYDGDGVTSAALWTRVLRSLGGNVDVFVPHRGRNGYDMRMPFVQQAHEDGVGLIVTTDCGIQRVDEVEAARAAGIDVIITDHHTPNANGTLPRALAVINPKRKDSRYPFSDLAGVGVAFKVCEALVRSLDLKVASFRQGFLDLAAIGTVTDVMPLIDENRIIVKHGLEALRTTKKPGLRALLHEAGYADKALDTRSISFGIGPRLNSASRIDETQIALDLLLTKDELEAQHLARRLNDLNMVRREVQDKIFEEAMEQIVRQDIAEARCLVLSGTNWAGGIVGIVASKIMERFNRPCVMISLDEATGAGRGSARSIHSFNIFDAIDSCKDLLLEYGGHAHAAGLSIEGANVIDFAAQMNRLAGATLTEEDFVPTQEVAAELNPEEMTVDLLQQIEAMAPFGNGNPEPYFVSKSVRMMEILRMGAEKQHLKLVLKAEGLNGTGFADALWWRMGDLGDHLEPGGSLDICYRPEFNNFGGRRRIQFMLTDLRPPEW